MKKRVLIIDDHADIREMYEAALKAQDYDVASEEDGIAGIKTALKFNPDLILLDIMMPKMDGFIVLSTLQNSKDAHYKVIVVSNLDGQEYIDRALNFGALKYMLKSDYTPDEIVAEINKICSNSH